tara:strand:- start:92 stop:1390 length:1299 start_codon:yes stop_codon:yes gene_type:complete
MATIDSNIAMGHKPVQIENPLNQLAAMTQIQSGQQGQQLNALQMRKAQQDFDTQNALAEAYKGAFNPDTGVLDYSLLTRRLAEGGAGSAIPGVIKYRTEADQAAELLSKTKIDAEKSVQALTSQMQRDLSRDPSDLNIQKNFDVFVSSGLFKPHQIAAAQAKRDQLLAMPFPSRQPFLSSIGATAGELKPVIKDRDIGGSIIPMVFDAYSGLPISTGQPIKKEATPGELLVDKRTREAVDRGERRDIVASTSTAADGTVTQFNKFGEVINRITAAGKPSATFEKTTALKKQLNTDLTTTIKELERVTADKGLIDQSTGSGAGRLADIGVGFFGGANEGAIATAKLRPIADMVLKMVPRFEGPQSDKDTASYKEAAGQLADPTVPNKIRKEAAIEIIRLMKNRKNQFVSDVMATEGMSAGAPPLPAGFTADKP